MFLMFLGVDVSKATLDVALVKDNKKPRHEVFANTEARHQQLLSWLKDNGAESLHACMEAIGTKRLPFPRRGIASA
jgi:transposase